MDHFCNRKVCLILSCDRPYYAERRLNNRKTYDYFKSQGFVLVFLFGDSTIYRLDEIDSSEFILRVPITDCYELLSAKMELAYRYFNEYKVSGILKIDDDIQILDEDQCTTNILTQLQKCDYYGIYSTTYRGNCNLGLKKHTLNLFRNLTNMAVQSEVKYMAGPFYWVSNSAVSTICKVGLCFLYEDVSVGYAVKSNTSLRSSWDEYYQKLITWNSDTEC